MERLECEVLVLGGGIAGATTSLCLGASGVKTICLEAKSHPRFVIGESTVPSTTLTFQVLGRKYGIKEFDGMCQYFHMKQLGITTWPKSHFYFALHDEGQKLDRTHEFLFETMGPPQGPDSHILREEADKFLVGLFPKYGVKYYDGISISQLNIGKEEEDPEIIARYKEDPQDTVEKEIRIRAKFVVDATGKASILARKFDMLEKDPALVTRSRTIYGHFKYGEDFCLDKACGGRNLDFRFSRNAGTMHHCFDGGWIWVIPFDNNTVSIGIMLDMDRWPYDENVSKEEEFWSHVNRYPTVKKHFSSLEPTKPLIRTGRVQLKVKSILGPRFIITPHASGFVDALFSTGMLMTSRFVLRFVPRIKKALQSNNFARDNFMDMEAKFFRELAFIDLMVSSHFAVFHNYELFKQIWRIWLESTFRQIVDTRVLLQPEAPLYGGHHVEWYECVKKCNEIVRRAKAEDPKATHAAAEVKALLDKNISFACRLSGQFELNKPETLDVEIYMRTEYELNLLFGQRQYIFAFLAVAISFIWSYWVSKIFGTGYHKYVDHFFQQRNPAHRNKYNFWLFLSKVFQNKKKLTNVPAYNPTFKW